mmetsp:Transcript_47053/g.102462  ORF Transcript_47053/g.102462 Transcript_47053/m.102462 type:complete len:229 (-) Transcript_47053:1572-2258(-)
MGCNVLRCNLWSPKTANWPLYTGESTLLVAFPGWCHSTCQKTYGQCRVVHIHDAIHRLRAEAFGSQIIPGNFGHLFPIHIHHQVIRSAGYEKPHALSNLEQPRLPIDEFATAIEVLGAYISQDVGLWHPASLVWKPLIFHLTWICLGYSNTEPSQPSIHSLKHLHFKVPAFRLQRQWRFAHCHRLATTRTPSGGVAIMRQKNVQTHCLLTKGRAASNLRRRNAVRVRN